MYFRKDSKKIKIDEFSLEIDFKYGIPLVVLDFIYAMTGFDVIEEIKKELEPMKNIERLNPDDESFQNYKSNIIDDFQDIMFQGFDELGELNLNEIQQEIYKRSLTG